MISGNILKNVKIDKNKEIFETIFKSDTIKIERIISNGQSSPPGFWYDQKENEFVIVENGEAVVEFCDGTEKKLSKGDYCLIPAHCKHRVSYTDPKKTTVWLALFFYTNPG